MAEFLQDAADEFLANEEEAQQSPDFAAGQFLDSELETATSENLDLASRYSADDTGKARAIGAQLGLPEEVVREDIPKHERESNLRRYKDVIRDRRVLREKLAADPQFAGVGHDEVDHLAKIEDEMGNVTMAWRDEEIRAATDMERRRLAQQDVRKRMTQYALNRGEEVAPKLGEYSEGGAWGGAVGVGMRTTESIHQATLYPLMWAGALSGGLFGLESGDLLEQGARQQLAESEGRVLQSTPDVGGGMAQRVYGAVQGVGANLPIFALSGGLSLAGASTGTAAGVASGVAGFLSGSETFADFRDEGRGRALSALAAGITGSLEVAGEWLPLEAATRLMGKGEMSRFLWEVGGKEVLGEEFTAIGQHLTEGYLRGQDTGTIVAGLPDTMLDAALGAVANTGMLTTMHATASLLQQATTDVSVGKELQSAANTIMASKMMERDPAKLAEFVNDLAQGGQTHVFVEAAALAQAVKDVSALPDSVRAQLNDALELNGDVAIPLGEFTTRILPAAPGLANEVRLTEGGMKAAEAQQYIDNAEQQFKQQLETTLKEYQEQAPFREEARVLHQNVMEQLAKANRFTPEVNRAYASMLTNAITTLAHRSGMTPAQVLQSQRGLAIGREAAGDKDIGYAQTVQQMKDRTKARLIDMVKTGALPKGSAFRGASIGELRNIARGGALVVGKDAEGVPGISAAPISEEGFPMYGGGVVGYIVPPDAYVESGRAAEVLVDEKYDPAKLTYVVNGELLSWDQLRKLAGPAKRDAAAEQWLREQTGGMDLDFTGALGQSLEELEAQLGQLEAQVAERVERRGEMLPWWMRNDNGPSIISLLEEADLSTFIHEAGHFFLEIMTDIAASPNAPAAIVQDFDALLQWFGVKGDTPEARRAEWVGDRYELDTKEKRLAWVNARRENLEKFARGFEKYWGEGKAPSAELESLFATMSRFIRRVYKTLTMLNVELTDEVRGVMNRMLATDEQITRAEALLNLQPLFESAQQAGMDPEAWAEYQSLVSASADQAMSDMDRSTMRDMAWLRNAKSRALREVHKDVQEKRKVEVDAAREILAEQRVFKAREFLRTGKVEVPADAPQDVRRAATAIGQLKHKLSLPALREMYGAGPAAPWRYLTTGANAQVAAEDGVHPDLVAPLLGYKSGDEMVKALLAAPQLDDAAQQLADVRLMQKYGDITNPKQLARSAELAVMNDARIRLAATQARALTKAIGSPKLLNKAAKRAAENMLNGRKVRDVLPGRFEAMVAKAGKLARDAFKKGSMQEAAVHERNRLLGMHATKLATKAQAEIERGVRAMRAAAKSKTLPEEYSTQIDALLERFNLHDTSRAVAARMENLKSWVAKQREMGIEPDLPASLTEELNRKPYQDMTLGEFRELVDAVRTIEHLGQFKRRLLNAKEKAEFDAIVAEARESIKSSAKGVVPEVRSDEQRGALAKAAEGAKKFIIQHRKFSSLVRELDAFKEGGRLWNLLVRPMNAAADAETRMTAEGTQAVAKILAPAFKKGLGKKTFVPEVGKTFSYEALLGIALNMGNRVNIERVMTGENWSLDQLKAVLGHLDSADWKIVQEVWDHLDSYRPAIAEKQKRLLGVEPEWVQPEPFVAPTGDVLRGGYYPIAYDPRRGHREAANEAEMVQKQMHTGLYTRATTARGHLEERQKSTGHKLRYDALSVVTAHLTKVIHDLAWHEPLTDMNRLLGAKPIADAITEHYGVEKYNEMRDTLRDIAIGTQVPQKMFDRVMTHLRNGSTIAGLAWNFTTAAMQVLGATQSIVRIGPVNFANGVGKIIGDAVHMDNAAKDVYERSVFMRDRGLSQNRAFNELLGQLTGKKAHAVRASFFWAIHQMQKVVDLPTWIGQYEAMKAQGFDEAEAVALADQAVRDSQGSGLISDRAGIERGSPAAQLFTAFYSFFNSTHNMAVEVHKQTRYSDPVSVARAGASYLMLYTVPASLGLFMTMALQGVGEDDDIEDIAKKLAAANLSYMMGTVVGLREFSAFVNGDGSYHGPAGGRLIGETVKLLGQIGQGEVDMPAFKAAVGVAGGIFHLPATAIKRLVEGTAALADGEEGVSPLAPLAGVPR